MFLNMELNRNKLKINKQNIKINELIEYKYKNNIQIIDIIKTIQTGK